MRAQYKSQGWWVGKQRTRAVASLEASNSQECDGPICAGAMASRARTRPSPDQTFFPPPPRQIPRALPNWQWVVPTLHLVLLVVPYRWKDAADSESYGSIADRSGA